MYPGESLAGASDPGLGIGPRRPLVLALLVSLVLHGLVLYALPILKESIRAPARPLTARLAKPVPPEPARVEPAPQRPPQPPPRPGPVTKSAPRLAAPAPVTVAPAPSVEPERKATEPALVVPAQEVEAATQSAPQPAAAAASGPDPGSVARFRLELMEIARRYKRYPRIAQDNNWEGRVELRIAFAENGSIASLTVKKGAGRAVLDDAAQGMIRSAQAQAAIPPALRGKAFVLEIPVDFSLKEER